MRSKTQDWVAGIGIVVVALLAVFSIYSLIHSANSNKPGADNTPRTDRAGLYVETVEVADGTAECIVHDSKERAVDIECQWPERLED